MTDIGPINDIYNKQSEFGIPSLNNMIINSTAEKDGKVIGYGVVKLFAEAFMILDPYISKKDKAKAFVEFMQTAILFSKDSGLEQLFVIVNDPSFSTILCKKYLFKRVPGELLMLDLTEKEAEDGK
jgi:hypothetical protein